MDVLQTNEWLPKITNWDEDLDDQGIIIPD